MKVYQGFRDVPEPIAHASVALGNFDGVHLGHQELIRRAVDHARAISGQAVIYTFDPHPVQILAPNKAPPLLTTLARKLELFTELGVDVCVVEPFDRELASMSPDDFVEQSVASAIGAEHVVVGYDFSYGHKRGGNANTLKEFGARRGFSTDIVQPVAGDSGTVASSTAVRAHILSGDVARAAELLGRAFDVDGVVIRGAGRGRTIGIPTANIKHSAELLPPAGVYGVTLQRLGTGADPKLLGAANLGKNPTFETRADLSLEVHVLDWDGDLYDVPVRVAFESFIRDERKFDGPEALVEQIRHDIDTVSRTLRAPNTV